MRQGLTTRELEVIVVDDGSTDDSRSLVTRNFPGVQLVQTEHGGPSRARNLGTLATSAPFIQYLDADDLLAQGKVRRQIAALVAQDADVAYGDWQKLIRVQGTVFAAGDVVSPRLPESDDIQVPLLTSFWCPPAAYLYTRRIVSAVMAHGGWSTSLPVIQDARFALDCALLGGRFVRVDGLTALYRQHTSGSVSTSNTSAFLRDCLINATQVWLRWESRGELTPARREALIQVFGSVAHTSVGRPADRALFEQAASAVSHLCGRSLPGSSPVLRFATRLMGYRRAQLIGARWRALRLVLSRPTTG